MSIKERSSIHNSGGFESPFLDQELFVGEPEEEWKPRVAALVAESPFRDVAYEEPPMSAIVPEVHEEETEPEEEGVHEKEYEYERQEGAALEWEDPGCAGEEGSLDVEAEWFDSEIWTGSADQIAFRDRVLAAHLALSKKARGAPLPDLSDDDALKYVPGTTIQTLPDTAAAAGRLLAAANADLARAQQAGDADALRTIRLTVNSGYRGSALQRNLWLGYFSAKGGYYDRTQAARENLPEGPHSDQAVAYMLKPKRYGGFGLTGRIAAPGYSNHQGGIAIDFWQERRKGHRIENKSDEASRGRWRSTWFHAWLKDNAATYGFKPIATEEWHWEYRPGATAAASSRSATRPTNQTRVG
jgi:LAS superfamily LD-carboxypeptidase LdcB